MDCAFTQELSLTAQWSWRFSRDCLALCSAIVTRLYWDLQELDDATEPLHTVFSAVWL